MSRVNVYRLMPKSFYDLYEDIREGRHREYILAGGRGSCKSSFVSVVILMGLMTDPMANAVIYRKVARTLKDSVYASVERAAGMMGIRNLLRFTKSPLGVEVIATGQKILFRGADDPMKSKSIAVSRGYFSYLWFEEMSEFSREEDLRSITQSVLRGSDEGRVIGTYNPPRSPAHWVNRMMLIPKDGRLTHFSTYLDVPRAWLGESFLSEAEALRKSNPKAYENEYLGVVTGSGGRVFENLKIMPLTDSELSACDKLFYGLDFGFAADPDAFTVWSYDRRNGVLTAIDEYVSVKDTAEKLAGEILKRAGKSPVTCDSADPRMISALRSMGVNARAARKGPGSRDHGYRWLETRAMIRADPTRTPVICRELEEYEYEKDREGRFTGGYPDGNDHTLDSARYALESEAAMRAAKTRGDIY